jgi:hypothetical protein
VSVDSSGIEDTLAIAQHEWRLRGVDRRDSAALAADLRQDLEAAAADGADPQRLIGKDVRGFARRLADEAGARRIPYHYRRLLESALVGAVPGILFGYGYVFVGLGMMPVPDDVPVQVTVAVYYSVPAAVVVAGILGAVWWRMRDVPRIRPTVGAMAVLLPVTGGLMTPVTMGFAYLTGYSDSGRVVFVEIAMVAGALAGATVLARRWALRGWPGR